MEARSKTQAETKPLVRLRPLTDNEKMLLVGLGIAVVLFIGITFVMTPQSLRIDELEAQKRELDDRVARINTLLATESDIRNTRQKLEDERKELLEKYFPVLDQPQIVYLLNDITAQDNLEISDMRFDKPSVETVSDIEVSSMRVLMPFNGRYTDVLAVIQAVESSPRRVKVDSVTIDRVDDLEVGGSMSLRVYSLEGLADTDPNVIPIPIVQSKGDVNPIKSFTGFEEVLAGEPQEPEGELLHDFESRNYDFIPSHYYVAGNAMPTSISKSGRYGLRLEYSIVAVKDENRAYVDISKQNIKIGYPPDRLTLWAYSFSYCPGNIGVRVMTQSGDVMHISSTSGVSWLGWSNISLSLPADRNLYPLNITHLYYEVPLNCDDFGVLVFDKLAVLYAQSTAASSEAGQEASDYFFYKVEPGDTISSISRKFYGTLRYNSEIMANNGISSGDVLRPGKILVLKKR